ncbi:hypothetical protein M3Y99_01019000 [Aphelenchoides fujianensis]|nr:hypothetical protein M3Y99_01019000 [Aphelenchoides fujianensis]
MSSDKLVSLRKVEAAELRGKSTMLLLDMYNRHFGPFRSLKKEQKASRKIAAEVNVEFEMFNSGYLTALAFPNPGDPRVSFMSGSFMDFRPQFAAWNFEGYVPPEKLDDYLRTSKPMHDKMQQAVQKFRALGVRKADVVVMIALALLKRIEHAGLMTAEFVDYKDELLRQWFASLKAEFGEERGVQQQSRLMLFYFEMDCIAQRVSAYFILQQMQLNSTDDFSCGISEHMQKLELDDE